MLLMLLMDVEVADGPDFAIASFVFSINASRVALDRRPNAFSVQQSQRDPINTVTLRVWNGPRVFKFLNLLPTKQQHAATANVKHK
jgi:hypothetical protein